MSSVDTPVRRKRIYDMLKKRGSIDVEVARREFLLQVDPKNTGRGKEILKENLEHVQQFLDTEFKELFHRAKCKDFMVLPPLLATYKGDEDIVAAISLANDGTISEKAVGIPDLYVVFDKNSGLIMVTLCEQLGIKKWLKYEMSLHALYGVAGVYEDSGTFFARVDDARLKYQKQRLLF